MFTHLGEGVRFSNLTPPELLGFASSTQPYIKVRTDSRANSMYRKFHFPPPPVGGDQGEGEPLEVTLHPHLTSPIKGEGTTKSPHRRRANSTFFCLCSSHET